MTRETHKSQPRHGLPPPAQAYACSSRSQGKPASRAASSLTLVAVLASLVLACSASGRSGETGGAVPEAEALGDAAVDDGLTPSLSSVGAACARPSDCSSKYCKDALCTCNKPDRGYVCASNADCCAGACSKGTCVSAAAPDAGSQLPFDGGSLCAAIGATCGGAAGGCCFGICNKTCSCVTGLDDCSADTDCCSGSCNPNLGGLSYCDQNTTGFRCLGNQDCSTGTCAKGKCACAVAGKSCKRDSDCCSTICVSSLGPIGMCG